MTSEPTPGLPFLPKTVPGRAWLELSHEVVSQVRRLGPGILTCATIAMAATFVSDHHGGPTLLYALLTGITLHFLWTDTAAKPGIDFTARTVLRAGVALLGVRISAGQIADLGFLPILLVLVGVAGTIGLGLALSRVLKLRPEQGVLTGGSVAICGASAALAIAAALPARDDKEREVLFTVVGVTVLSTVAMIVYPVLAQALGLSDTEAGILFGATIHDVAQVVGAGHLVSDQAAVVATYVKLLRVALLVPVVMIVAWAARKASRGGGVKAPVLPGFLVAFAVLAILNSLNAIPSAVSDYLAAASRWFLVCAVAAIGVKTSFGELRHVGPKPLLLLVCETGFLLILVVLALVVAGSGISG